LPICDENLVIGFGTSIVVTIFGEIRPYWAKKLVI
jgi:hypothetical protein